MIKTVLLLGFLFCFCSGNGHIYKFQSKKSISFFRATGYYKNFFLKVNNTFTYSEKNQTKGEGAFGYLITKYSTESDRIKVYLKVNSRDTIFNYDVSKYDSLMIGLNDDNHFFVFNEREYVWAND
jgi:hypothetical protein